MASTSQLKKVITIKNDKGHSAAAMCSWQKGSGNYLALRFEGVHVVFIYDRQGKLFKRIPIPTNCSGLEWDCDGDVLAIMIETAGMVVLWEVHSSKLIELDTGLREISSVIAWSNFGKHLALGTVKGNVMAYDHRTLRKIPVLGTHNKKIICARWSRDDIVAFATMEDQISLNTKSLEHIRTFPLRGRASDLKFGYVKEDGTASGTTSENTVSCIVNEKTLFLSKFDDPAMASPLELGFQARYGNILAHFWHGDGYIVLVFVGGFIVLLSSHHKEIGTELVLCELKDDIVRHAAFNLSRGWISICGGSATLEIHDASEPKTVLGATEVSDDEGRIRQIVRSEWTDDGQLVSVSNAVGDVILYLTSVPMMGGANFNQLACMSSLTDCALYSFVSTTGQPSQEFVFQFGAQPNLVVLGPVHLAAIIHSSAHLFNTRKEISALTSTPSVKKEFNSGISEFVLNYTYCAARTGSTAQLHRIEGQGLEKNDVKCFPEPSAKGFKISALAIAKEIFLYGGESGQIRLFHLEQFTEILSIDLPLPSPSAIKGIHPDLTGGQVAILDKHGSGFYFDILRPFDQGGSLLKPIPNFPVKGDTILFDQDVGCRHIFLVSCPNSGNIHLYSGWRDSARGTDAIEFVGTQEPFKLSPELKPICLKKGVVCALTGTGRIERAKSLYQNTQFFQEGAGDSSSSASLPDSVGKLNIIKSLVNLRLFNEAYELCCVNQETSDSNTNWAYLADAALEFGELEIAARSHAKLGNVGMVVSIRRLIDGSEDLMALQGEVALIRGDFDLAEAKFLEAGLRERAIQLRRDLQEWNKAMEMADRFGSSMISEIAREMAAVCEYQGDYQGALKLFQKARKGFVGSKNKSMKQVMNQIITRSMAPGGRNSPDGAGDRLSPTAASKSVQFQNLTDRDLQILLDIDKGLARNMLRCSLDSEAMELLSQIVERDPLFVKECAKILEQEKKFEKAAKLYLESGEEVKAAVAFIKMKNYAKAEDILKRKSAPDVWRQFAKAKEAEGNIIEAARAYADAQDYENGIRLYLTLGIPEEAAALARASDDPQDAVKVALYYLENGDLDEALKYLIRSECYHDALANAFKYGKTEAYADFVFHHFEGNYPEGFAQGLSQVAADFETKKDYFRAGKCFMYLRQHSKAFHLLLKLAQNRVQANEEEVMMALIHNVVYAEDDEMSRLLVEFLLGESDDAPRDPAYLHYFYVMAERFVEAAKTAVIVSRSYQEQGSFQEARNSVFDSMCWVRSTGGRHRKEMIDQFNQTQSYMILKVLLNQKDKTIPARIIKRVFEDISNFQKACPGLLLAGVNACQQARLKQSARQMAFTLIREYKTQLDDKFRPAIEQLVRKTAKMDCVDEGDKESPCPYCDKPVGDFSLDCKSCKSLIPMCIITGQHILKADLGACFSCNFPFRFSEMKRFQGIVKECPLCGANWEGNSMKKLNDLRPYLYESVTPEQV